MNAHTLAPDASPVKSERNSLARHGLRKIVAEWLERGLQHSGLSQGAAADRAKVARSTVNRIAKGKVDADPDTIKRLERVLAYPFPNLEGVFQELEPIRTKSYRRGLRLPQGETSRKSAPAPRGAAATLAGQPGALPNREPAVIWGAVLDALNGLPEDVQRAVAVQAVRRGIEAQELQGPSLLRAMVSLCGALDKLGYPAMAREIRSELMKTLESEAPGPDP